MLSLVFLNYQFGYLPCWIPPPPLTISLVLWIKPNECKAPKRPNSSFIVQTWKYGESLPPMPDASINHTGIAATVILLRLSAN